MNEATIKQEPYNFRDNVVVTPPRNIEVLYAANDGWWIKIDGVNVIALPGMVPRYRVRYWEKKSDALNYLKDKELCEK